jgi:hypothetical protein
VKRIRRFFGRLDSDIDDEDEGVKID